MYHQLWKQHYDGTRAGALNTGIQAGGRSIGAWWSISVFGCPGSGCSARSIDDWVKADAIGALKEPKSKPVNADQMKIARLRAELAKASMERAVQNVAEYFARLSRVDTPLLSDTER